MLGQPTRLQESAHHSGSSPRISAAPNQETSSPVSVQVYVRTVSIIGLTAVVAAALALDCNRPNAELLILIALTLLSGAYPLTIPAAKARVSTSETYVFASVLAFGHAAGTLTVVLETIIILSRSRTNHRTLQRSIFNIAAPAASIYLAGLLYEGLISNLAHKHLDMTTSRIAAFTAFVMFHYVVSTLLVATALALERRSAVRDQWWPEFKWVALSHIIGAPLAALIVSSVGQIEYRALLLTIPLLVTSHLAFRRAVGQRRDSTTQSDKLNQLYLSIINSLATAIDAKDQVTHGHILRVQQSALALARDLGLTHSDHLDAVAVAATLHDVGKLAVSEAILNKPGQLTIEEFEIMQRHVNVGVDILASIEFPCPVVELVRAHHENWDGTGYPSGTRGLEIPIGARILAVVDCYDAITSDRPYRRALSHREARRILLQRRGKMYDPLIVDAFLTRTFRKGLNTPTFSTRQS